MKRILGLDLGTTSIGWALVNEAESDNEKSKIIKTGVRVIPLTTDESADFEKGKATSINADRTLKRGMRRNLQRYKQRRDHLSTLLTQHSITTNEIAVAETGKNSTHSTYKLRAKSATEKVSLGELARVLFAINKKRGYKSNRKAKDEGDGQAIDGMEVAKELYNQNLTPGEYCLTLLSKDKKHLPDFYRSDLQMEFDKIWETQKKWYSEILSDELRDKLKEKNKGQTWKICEEPFGIQGIKLDGKKKEVNLQKYQLRVESLTKKILLEHLAIVLQEVNAQITNSSGYLGAISDRSKELFFNKITVGQYLYEQIKENAHTRLKNQVFYRQDYLDEFEKIWETQATFHSELASDLKVQIRDTVIFYQRRLKSQKGLISICELEGREIELKDKDGKPILNGKSEPKRKIIGPRVVPKSSPLFQEFKIWQVLNNLTFTNSTTKEKLTIHEIDEDCSIRKYLHETLTFSGKLSSKVIIKEVMKNPKNWELNFKEGVEGNNTLSALYKVYEQIVELSGHEIDFKNYKKSISEIFESLGIKKEILDFDTELEGKNFERQASYQLWHLLYSYEGDNSNTGNDALFHKLKENFGFGKTSAQLLNNVTLKDDYGSLSSKAIKKILPHLKEGHEYSEACSLEGYNHSHSFTKDENEKRKLDKVLELLPKNSLRNPVVEKILNQMVNVVNAIIEKYGSLDEVRVELARELKKSGKERAEMTANINKATKEHDLIRAELGKYYPFNSGIRITKTDIIKYKLYKELTINGHKTLYTNAYIELDKLFTKEFDIEHIIPKAVLFDDSFSNKTLAVREFNRYKSSKTGYDAVLEKYGEDSKGLQDYIDRADNLLNDKKISRSKHKKLLMKGNEIPDGFIERDLRNSQYIAKKAQSMLYKIARHITPTTGSITNKLREDWQLINVMQELNWDKYEKLGLTTHETNKHGDKIRKIIDWTKRNDHRHHAMDALTVAFTKHSHVQYFNYKNARRDENHKQHGNIIAIEKKELYESEYNKKLIKPPLPIEEFRRESKRHLEMTLISFKAKNKVVTQNKNITKKKTGTSVKIELTPRGQLHKETVYGKSKTYETKLEKVGPKFDIDTVNQVAKKSHREALTNRLAEFDDDPKKAFGGKNALAKNPIYLDSRQSEKLPEKVKLVFLIDQYTIRKDVSPDLKVDKVIDRGTQRILQQRLTEFDNDPKKAFTNLEESPIWLNKEKGIQLKRVTITGVSNAEPLHYKKDHFGKEILDKDGKPIDVDYVSTGNNHHVAIYKDGDGNLQEQVVSFYEAVIRKNEGLAIIDKAYNQAKGWEFMFTMKQNEYFVFPNTSAGFDPSAIDLTDEKNYSVISPNLFRVQKIATKDYFFRHHLETMVENNSKTKSITWKREGISGVVGIIKVRINHLGEIVKVGEY